MVVLRDVGHPKIQAHMVQKRRLWQLHALGLEISRHIKDQAVSALLQAGIVIKRAIRVAAICIQCETFHQRGKLPLGGVQADVHARCGTAVHGVHNGLNQTHIGALLFICGF